MDPPTTSLPGVEQQANGALAVTGVRTKLELRDARRLHQAHKEYGRGRRINVKGVRDKKLRRNLTNLEERYKTATLRAKDAEILLENTGGCLEPETELERTYKVRQDEIQACSAIGTAQKKFDLKLEVLGPYMCEYTRNGRELLLAGRKGHIATMDWRVGKLGVELQLGETIRDVRWLHNNQYFAAAQKYFVYIYDRQGVELHCLRKHREVSHMEFLPYHFLLATLGMSGLLKYQDVSTGQIVSEASTKLGAPVCLAQNPHNAILHVGHQTGTVTLWSPNSSEPLVKLLAHRGPVRALGVDRGGRYMVSTGQDNRMAVWDIRMWKEVESYLTRTPATSVAISDRDLVAVGWGTHTTIWKGLFAKDGAAQERVTMPYLTWGGEGQAVERARWCPFEDVLGIGHSAGFASVIVPGAGEANFDALEANPFETKKQRQEGEVKGLLNKLKPEMIALDPNFVGNLDLRSEKQRRADRDLDSKADGAKAAEEEADTRNRARGKNRALKKYMRKLGKRNIVDDKSLKDDERFKEELRKAKKEEEHQEKVAEFGPALARFARKEK